MMTPFEAAVCGGEFRAGFARAELEAYGIAWPPPMGWRDASRAKVLAREGARSASGAPRRDNPEEMILGQMGAGAA